MTMAKSKDWREFERLVARIERTASPHGAVVTSPDRIRDLTTGQMREVDASIRHKLGTAEVLITVECRKRVSKGDDTWIEQLATKRSKIGTAKTIAVSSAGFTSSASKSAKYFGIELRTLSEVSAADIESWFLPGGAVHVFRLIEDIRCFVVLYEDSGEPSKYGFYAPDVEAPAFYHDEHRSPFPIRDYIPLLELTHPEMFADVPFDGTKVELEFPIEWRLGNLQVATTVGKKSAHFTKLIAKVSCQSAVCDMKSGVHHEYTSPDGAVVQHTAFNTELFGLSVTFEHQSDPSGGQTASFKFGPRSGEQRPNQQGLRRRKGLRV
jgi:hypothetical protein